MTRRRGSGKINLWHHSNQTQPVLPVPVSLQEENLGTAEDWIPPNAAPTVMKGMGETGQIQSSQPRPHGWEKNI